MMLLRLFCEAYPKTKASVKKSHVVADGVTRLICLLKCVCSFSIMFTFLFFQEVWLTLKTQVTDKSQVCKQWNDYRFCWHLALVHQHIEFQIKHEKS